MRHLNSLRGQTINSDAALSNPAWAIVGWSSKDEANLYSSRQVTGINRIITLQVYFNPDGELFYAKNINIDNGNDYTSAFDPTGLGFTQLEDGDRFTVQNNDWIDFGAIPVVSSVNWVTIYNVTDGFKILDYLDLEAP